MDGLENNAIIHFCLEDWGADDGNKRTQVTSALRRKEVCRIFTIEVDTSQSNHAQHKRKVTALEQPHGHQH